MKKTLLLLALITSVVTLFGQTRVWQTFPVDTLTNTDTSTFVFDRYLYTQGDFTWQIVADSLSGSTAATCKIQGTYYPGSTVWSDIATITVNGVQTNTTNTTTLFNGIQTRMRCTSGGTQSTKLSTVNVIYKERQ